MNYTDPDHTDTNTSDTPNTAAEQRTAETHKNSRLALSIAFLALFFTVLGITVGYKHWLRIHDKAKLALTEIQSLQQQLEQTANKAHVETLREYFEETSSAAEQRLASSLQELDQIREKTAYSAKTVTDQIAELTLQQQIKTSDHNPLPLLSEIRFLLETAQRRLNMNYDKKSALALLEEADQLLIQLGSPQWLPVREKLAEDIARLQQFPLPDIEKLSNRITKLENAIKPLAQIEKELPNSKEISLFEIEETNSFPGKVKKYLNESITIRKQTDPPRYVLDKSNKERIDLLLKLRLESLRLLLMQRHNKAYHEHIKKLEDMLNTYYAPSVAKPWIADLQQLDMQNLAPPLPTISTALDQFVTLLSEHSPQGGKPQ